MIVKRSLYTYSLLLPGYALNFILLAKTADILDTQHFGVLYSFISFINICTIPVSFICVLSQDHFSKAIYRRNLIDKFSMFQTYLERIGALNFVLFFSFLFIFVALKSFFADLSLIWILGVLSVVMSFTIEISKTLLLSYGHFFWYSLITPIWLLLRFSFTLVFVSFVPKAISGAVGILLAPILLIFFIFYRFGSVNFLAIRSLNFTKELSLKIPTLFGDKLDAVVLTTVFGIFCYLDLIVIFIYFDLEFLGIYAQSAALPKMLPMVMYSFSALLVDSLIKSTDLKPKLLLLITVISVFALATIALLEIKQSIFEHTCFGDIAFTDCVNDIFFFSWYASSCLCISRLFINYMIVLEATRQLIAPTIIVMLFFILLPLISQSDQSIACIYMLSSFALASIFGIISFFELIRFKRNPNF